MLYLSQLLGAPVENLQNERVGKISDVFALQSQVGSNDAAYPTAFLVEGDNDQFWRVPPALVERHENALHLRAAEDQLQPTHSGQLGESEVRLGQEILDKQVIDIERRKAVRVNDVCFADDWQILGIDNSTLGLVRRLAPAWLLGPRERAVGLIPWSRIELIGSEHHDDEQADVEQTTPSGSLRAQTGHLAELWPADIAEIVHQLSPGQGARIIERLDDETAADTLEEIDTESQRRILENIPVERAADILQAMGPDEAADLIAQLPEDRAQELLRLMTPEESEDVQELLEYEANTAGGLMTTQYLVLHPGRMVAEALEAVRTKIREEGIRSAYIYCVEDETQDQYHLLGIVSLWDLLAAAPTDTLAALMEQDIISVRPDTEPRQVAEVIAKYNLLAVPVIDEAGVLEGVITVDDALDVLLPEARRRKPNRMY